MNPQSTLRHALRPAQLAIVITVTMLATATACGDDFTQGDTAVSGINITTSDSATGSATTAATGSGTAGSGSAGGSCTIPETGEFADCVNATASACMHPEASCLVNNTAAPDWGICFIPCEADCDCWQAPASGTALASCSSVLSGAGRACALDCQDGRICPDGMRCAALSAENHICVFDALGQQGSSSGEATVDTETSSTGL